MAGDGLATETGFASAIGPRSTNDDFVAALTHHHHGRRMSDTVAVIADGLGGGPGGRLAAETTARAFLDGYFSLPATLGVHCVAERTLAAMSRWVSAQGRQNPTLASMATTFTALILRGRQVHVVHVGDTRCYRLRDARLERLTEDHVHPHPDLRHVLVRAVGLEDNLRVDYAVLSLRPHDRFLLCSDGVHGVLSDKQVAVLLAGRDSPAQGARRIVEAALAAGGQDNTTALVLDVIALPAAQREDLEMAVTALPILELPREGEMVDGFRLIEGIAGGRYSQLFRAEDTLEQREVMLKFPHPRLARDYRRAFVREAWVAAQASSPYLGEVLELPPGRQTRLYTMMPFYAGETLEQRLLRAPPIGLEEGVAIGMALGKAVYVLNRRGVIHRDIKPENVVLERNGPGGRGLRLVDLGVARVPALEDDDEDCVSGTLPGTPPGTPSYMAPERLDGAPGDERTEVYALGVTLYRMFSRGHYPYGEVEAFSHPRFTKRQPLSRYRSDLPAWLDAVLARATAVVPQARHGDAMELAFELENGLAQGADVQPPRRPLYERNPVRFWQGVSALLAMALIAVLAV